MKKLIAAIVASAAFASPLFAAGEVSRVVRFKISAGDLTSAIAAAEDYKAEKGVDVEYLDAIGWIARGAEILRRPELARQYVAELHQLIPAEKDETLTAYGAAIEVEGRLIAASDGRGAGIRYFERALADAKATSLRSRIAKNINLLSLEGAPAPAIAGQNLRAKPTLLFFWMAGCGDCKAQAPALQRVWQKYGARGLQMVAVTRLYGGAEKTADVEKAEISKFWVETYPSLTSVTNVIDTEAMVRYGASATPTFVLVDKAGVVRLYTPTRLSEAELSRRIDAMLAE